MVGDIKERRLRDTDSPLRQHRQTNSCRFNYVASTNYKPNLCHSSHERQQLRQNRATQTTDTTQRPLKANTLVSTDTTQTLERTQTLDISLTTERVIATAPTSDGEWGPRICPATLWPAASPPRPVASGRRRLLAVDLCAGRCMADKSTSGRCPVRPTSAT